MEDNSKDLTDAEILERVIEALDTNPHRLGVRLGYKSPSASIRNVLIGDGGISKAMMDKIVEEYPQVNYLFLAKGQGEPLNTGASKQNQQNMMQGTANLNDLLTIPKLLRETNELLSEILEKMK